MSRIKIKRIFFIILFHKYVMIKNTLNYKKKKNILKLKS